MSGSLKNEELFPGSKVHRCLFFSFNLFTTVRLFYTHFRSYTFFVGRYHTPCLSTDSWFVLFPTILVTQEIVGVMGNTLPIWVHGVGDISDVILSCWILCICVWDPDRDFAPLHKDYTSS